MSKKFFQFMRKEELHRVNRCKVRGFEGIRLKTDHVSENFGKNKTHKKLTRNMSVEYKARVTKVTALETNKGIGKRCGDARARGLTGGC